MFKMFVYMFWIAEGIGYMGVCHVLDDTADLTARTSMYIVQEEPKREIISIIFLPILSTSLINVNFCSQWRANQKEHCLLQGIVTNFLMSFWIILPLLCIVLGNDQMFK